MLCYITKPVVYIYIVNAVPQHKGNERLVRILRPALFALTEKLHT